MLIDKEVNAQNKTIATVLAYALMPLAGLATDVYLPSLPGMTQSLQVSDYYIQLTLSLFLISYGVSQVLVGSILDVFGRYKLTLLSLVVFILASLVIVHTANIYLILLMRIVHGVTAGIIVTSKRAFFVDVYEGEALKQKLSSMTIVWSLAPILAPFLGGYIDAFFDWQGNFYVLAIYATLLLVLEICYSGESIREKHAFNFKRLSKAYAEMLSTSDFIYTIMILGLSYSGAMVYSMVGPFIIEHEMHYTPITTGYAALVLGFSWMAGGIISKKLILRASFFKGIRSLAIQLLIALGMILWGISHQNLYSMIGLVFLIHVCAGFLFNIFFTIGVSRFPKYAGINGGLMGGGMYFVISVFSSAMVGTLNPASEYALGISYFLLTLFTVPFLLLWRKHVAA